MLHIYVSASNMGESECDLLEWIIPCLSCLVHSDIIAAVGLIDVDISLEYTTVDTGENTRVSPFLPFLPYSTNVGPNGFQPLEVLSKMPCTLRSPCVLR